MSKYSKYQKPPIGQIRYTHPIWRGIGFLLMIIVPILSYAAATLIVRYGVQHGWPFPAALIGYTKFPDWVWETPVLPLIAAPIANYRDLWAILLVFVVLIFLLSGFFSTLYAILYRFTGPPRYTALDAPPPKHKPKAYKR